MGAHIWALQATFRASPHGAKVLPSGPDSPEARRSCLALCSQDRLGRGWQWQQGRVGPTWTPGGCGCHTPRTGRAGHLGDEPGYPGCSWRALPAPSMRVPEGEGPTTLSVQEGGRRPCSFQPLLLLLAGDKILAGLHSHPPSQLQGQPQTPVTVSRGSSDSSLVPKPLPHLILATS